MDVLDFFKKFDMFDLFVVESVSFRLNNLYKIQHGGGIESRPTISNYNGNSGHTS